jgi:hypothetical protein
MRRLIAASLLVLIAGLPAIDVVCCPDGCSDSARPALSVSVSANTDEVSNEQGCGLCTNAVAVRSPVLTAEPGHEFVLLREAIAPPNPDTSLHSIDRPPRRA